MGDSDHPAPCAGVAPYIPTRGDVRESLRLLLFVVAGSLVLYPIVSRLPMLGWDWGFFFTSHNPTFNIGTAASAYPPFTRLLLTPLTVLPWRASLALLNSATLLTIAAATWRRRRSYPAVVLALLSPPLWFLLWIGHPDGLVLLGMLTGLIPLALIKPQLAIIPLLRTKRSAVWTFGFLVLSLVLFPGWPLSLRNATLSHEAAFGWAVTGWPVALLGLAMLAGSGDDPYRLMAAGFLISPYMMPYNLAILLPAIGNVSGAKRIPLWAATYLTLLGTGIGGLGKYLNFVFPLAAYFLTLSFNEYRNNVRCLFARSIILVKRPLHRGPAA